MDGGVRRLAVVNVTGATDERDVAYAFVRREYAFDDIAEENVDGTALHPLRPFIVCSVLSLREFIEQFPFLSKRQLDVIGNMHDIQFRSRLTIRLRVDALHRHARTSSCAQILYKFRALDRPCTVNLLRLRMTPVIP